MLIKPLAFIFAITFGCLASADISVEVKQAKVLTGLKNPKIAQNFVLFEDNIDPQFSSAAIVKISTDSKFVKVKARKTLFENADVVKLYTDAHEYLLVGNGKYALEITTFDPEKGIDEKIISVDLGETPNPPDPPNPPSPPSPNVPNDKFDNIGKRVAEWSVGLPKKLEISALYRDAAKQLIEDPSVTVSEVGKMLADKRKELLGQDLDKYSKVFDNIYNDLKNRWPLVRQDYAEYLIAINKGLGGQ